MAAPTRQQQPLDYNATPQPGDPLRGGTQGGETARGMSGIDPEGTPDLERTGGAHVPTPAQPREGVDAGPGEHILAGGKSPDDIQRYLEEIQFPAKKDSIVRVAARNGAPNDIVHCLSSLPMTDYGSFAEVIRDYPRLPEPDDLAKRTDAGPGAKRV